GGLGDGGAVWVDDPGTGMVLTFNGNDETGAVVKAGKIPAIGVTDDFTWAFWARQEGDGTGEFETILGNRDVGVSYPRFIMFTPTKFEYFVNTDEYVINHEAVEGLDYPDLQDGVWTHHAIIKEGSTLIYYRNGIETGRDATSVDQGENALYIGGDLVSGRWSGSMYNVRVYKRALSVAELETALRRDPAKAWDPTPVHGRIGDIAEASTLTWQPGDTAIEHDVYFGLDAQAVALATPEDTTGLYGGRQSSTEYTPDDLQMDQTYYWRIDQINGDQSLSQGYVWRFTVTPYLIVDDFDRYTNFTPDRVFQTWVDGWGFSADDYYPDGNPGNGTGAAVGHDIWSFNSAHYNGDIMETSNTPAGSTQAMPIYYNNAGGSGRSEVDRAFTPGEDWTVGDVTTLVLHVRGEADNTGQLYCKINGTKVAYNGDPTDISSPAWRAWEIDLASVGVNLTNITTLTLGIEAGQSGVIYIDDIRLYPEDLVDPGE
ncbi:MAG: LamG domain-containing protein, partial [Phycisphaeraceae bacterium]|nr:LamG domain-containing protein [Phycisphaeraceae bacterium]